MYYEINVSKNGKHFFATSERSITSEDKLNEVYGELKRAFPVSDGYKMNVTYWEKQGQSVDMPEDNVEPVKEEPKLEFPEFERLFNKAQKEAYFIGGSSKMRVTIKRVSLGSEKYVQATFYRSGLSQKYYSEAFAVKTFGDNTEALNKYYDDLCEYVHTEFNNEEWLYTHEFYFQ